MSKLFQLFKTHPASVGESYWQHMAMSLSFSIPLFLASMAALVHSIFPFLFVKTGSTTISKLHDRMVLNRKAQFSRPTGPHDGTDTS